MKEEAVHFGDSGSLVGVITHPSVETGRSTSRVAIIFLNSGILHRVGPNRLHVTIARELAALGHLSFRIDLSGVGDSPAYDGGASIGERWAAETRAAMQYLMQTRNVEQFVLIGNCSGAAVALLTATFDRRVAGTILINLEGPRVYLRYYFRLAFRTFALWRRLFKGTVRYRDLLRAASDYVRSLGNRRDEKSDEAQFDIDAALAGFAERGTRMLLVYCAWDPSLDFFKMVLKPKLDRWISKDKFHAELIPGMNHDFTMLHGQQRLRDIVCAWIAAWER